MCDRCRRLQLRPWPSSSAAAGPVRTGAEVRPRRCLCVRRGRLQPRSLSLPGPPTTPWTSLPTPTNPRRRRRGALTTQRSGLNSSQVNPPTPGRDRPGRARRPRGPVRGPGTVRTSGQSSRTWSPETQLGASPMCGRITPPAGRRPARCVCVLFVRARPAGRRQCLALSHVALGKGKVRRYSVRCSSPPRRAARTRPEAPARHGWHSLHSVPRGVGTPAPSATTPGEGPPER